MADLFLIRHLAQLPAPADVSLLLRPAADGATWDSCRRPQDHRKQSKHTLRHLPDGWALMDDTSGVALYRPGAGASQERDRPPLGPWRRVPVGKERGEECEECTLTDVEPTGARISENALQAPYADFVITDAGDVVTLETSLRNIAITEAGLDALMREFKAMLLEVAKRPRAILNLQLCLNGAPVPSMRVVKQYMNFALENAPLIDLMVRGFAVVLKPEGYVGYALSNIVKMVMRALPTPWEFAVVQTLEEGRAFIAQVALVEVPVLARRVGPDEAPQMSALGPGKGGVGEEATPSTAEPSPLGACGDATPCNVAEQPSKEESPKEQPPRERAPGGPPSPRQPAGRADEEEDERLELENPEPRGCWGVGWLLACQGSKP